MIELKVNLEDAYGVMLQSFKPVVEAVIEESLEFDTYVNMIIWRGVRAMIEDIIPRDPEILMKSILMMHESNPEFVASFINSVLAAGAAREGAKQRLGFIKDG